MKQLSVLFLLWLPAVLYAQADAGGTKTLSLRTSKSNYDIYGSPFFGDQFCYANVKARNGNEYIGLKVKLDLFENGMIYLNEEGEELIASATIDRISFYDCEDPSKNKILISGMPPIDKQDESNFYVLLDSGNVSLLKFIKVEYTDKVNTYGSANIRRVYRQHEFYYAHEQGNKLIRIDKDEVANVFGARKNAVLAFIASNNLKIRKEADLVKVFSYYNSLK